jgi:hypothetical protein
MKSCVLSSSPRIVLLQVVAMESAHLSTRSSFSALLMTLGLAVAPFLVVVVVVVVVSPPPQL